MDILFTLAGLILAIYLIIKLNKVATVSIDAINTVVTLADESVKVYASDVRINLAQKKTEQLDELIGMDYIPTSADIEELLAGKAMVKPENKPKTRPEDAL